MKPTTLGLATFLIATSAFADPAIITGGKAGGTYQTVYGANLAQILKAKGHDVQLLES